MPAPETLEDIKADAKMMAAYLAYSKRLYTDNEVLFYFDKGNAAGIYPKYIDPDGQKPANIDSKTIRLAKELADNKDFNNPKWKEIITGGKREVAKQLTGDIGNFVSSKEYKLYLRKEKMGDPAKAAKVLGIKDVKKLTKAMEAMVDDDKQEGQKLLGELAKTEHLVAKVADMMKALEKAGLV
jgi:hypothetical protein